MDPPLGRSSDTFFLSCDSHPAGMPGARSTLSSGKPHFWSLVCNYPHWKAARAGEGSLKAKHWPPLNCPNPARERQPQQGKGMGSQSSGVKIRRGPRRVWAGGWKSS